jgi:hypothetical protein
MSFQQLLGKKTTSKPEQRGRPDAANNIATNAVPVVPDIEDEDSSMSSHGGNGSTSFLTSVLDTLYDSYRGREAEDDDDQRKEEAKPASRLQLSFSSLVGI